jgi:hypothetical protein
MGWWRSVQRGAAVWHQQARVLDPLLRRGPEVDVPRGAAAEAQPDEVADLAGVGGAQGFKQRERRGGGGQQAGGGPGLAMGLG